MFTIPGRFILSLIESNHSLGSVNKKSVLLKIAKEKCPSILEEHF
jgi:hypothetical protein